MKVATSQLSFLAVTLLFISSSHNTDATIGNLFPSLENYWSQLWNPQPTDQKNPVWFIVSQNGQSPNGQQLNTKPQPHQTELQQDSLKYHIQNPNPPQPNPNPNPNPHLPHNLNPQHSHMATGILIPPTNIQQTPIPQPQEEPKTTPQTIPQQIPTQETPRIPHSINQWSSLNPSQLPGIPYEQKQFPFLTNSNNKPSIPYPVVVQPGAWHYYLPQIVNQPTNGQYIPNGYLPQPPPTVQHHVVEGNEGFAGLPGKIKAHLTLNYVPPSSSEVIALSTVYPTAKTVEIAAKTPSTVGEEVFTQETTTGAASNSLQEFVEGSGAGSPKNRKDIEKRTVPWFIHRH